MRVLLVANTLPPKDISGVGEQVLQLASGLREAGHSVRILGRGKDGALGPKLLFPVTVVPPLLRELREFKPHVVQVHESDGALAAFFVATLRGVFNPVPVLSALLQVSYLEEIRAVRPLRYGQQVLGRPGAVEKRFRWIKAPVQILFGWMTGFLADINLAPSRATVGELQADYGLERVSVLPNVTGGLDLPVAEDCEPDCAPGFLLFVGRLRIRKGVEVLLHSIKRLLVAGLAPRVLIVGDGEHGEALRKTAARLELADSVVFVGRKGPSEVRALLQDALALVVPSTYEGMPLVVLEAMDSAKPVIASRVSGTPEVVLDGSCGWLVDPEDPVQLAAAIQEAIENPGTAAQRGLTGQTRVREHFRPANAAALWVDTISNYLGTSVKDRESGNLDTDT